MNTLSNVIADYLGYLETGSGISVSVHFDPESKYTLPDSAGAPLLDFNSHKNPYCMIVKKELHNKCLHAQSQLYSCCTDSGICHICHAGVLQYIYPLHFHGEPIGFAAISGFRQSVSDRAVDPKIWQQFLSEAQPPTDIYDKLLAPLEITSCTKSRFHMR